MWDAIYGVLCAQLKSEGPHNMHSGPIYWKSMEYSSLTNCTRTQSDTVAPPGLHNEYQEWIMSDPVWKEKEHGCG